jgi:hypothetical protein
MIVVKINFELKVNVQGRQKDFLNLLIKKKRIVQLINGKSSKNHYKKTTQEQHLTPKTCNLQTNMHSQPTTLSSQHMEHHDANKIYTMDNSQRVHHSSNYRRFPCYALQHSGNFRHAHLECKAKVFYIKTSYERTQTMKSQIIIITHTKSNY